MKKTSRPAPQDNSRSSSSSKYPGFAASVQRDKQGYPAFRHDVIRAANCVELQYQFVGSDKIPDTKKSRTAVVRKGFWLAQINAAFKAWNSLSAAMNSENDTSIMRRCGLSKDALLELDSVVNPETQGAK